MDRVVARPSTGLTAHERKAGKVFTKAVRKWYRKLLIDPVWTVNVVIVDDGDMLHGAACVDIGAAEHYTADIYVSRSLLSLPENELKKVACETACHEILHLLTADFQRGIIVATGDNDKLRDELRYRYEQVVSRLSMILVDLTEKDKHVPNKGKDPGTTEEVLRMPEMPIGDRND